MLAGASFFFELRLKRIGTQWYQPKLREESKELNNEH